MTIKECEELTNVKVENIDKDAVKIMIEGVLVKQNRSRWYFFIVKNDLVRGASGGNMNEGITNVLKELGIRHSNTC